MSNDIETLVTEIESLKNELISAKKEASKAKIAKDNFIANLSYEIRTPMNCVLGFSHFLLDTALDAEQQENIEDLCSASSQLIDTINAIVDLAKMEAGDLKIESSGFLLKNVIDKVYADIKPLLVKNNFSIAEPDMYWEDFENLDGDPKRIKQILTNVLTTAIDHTKMGTLSFDISIASEENNCVTLRFEIIDSNTVLSPATIQAMFLKFTDDDTTDQSLYTCSGIGLSLSEHLCNLMHGSIGIDTSADSTTYWIELPFAHVSEVPNDNTRVSDLRSDIAILIAEDNSLNQKMISRMLTKEGFHTITIAHDGVETLELVQLQSFDVILMDMQMPQINGLEAAMQIRQMNDTIAHVPIIALTANALESDIRKCLQAGMNDHLAKPIKKEDLLNKLRKWVK